MATQSAAQRITHRPSEVLTLTEAAAYLRVPEATLQSLAAENMVPARKVGKEWRFLTAALQDWLRGDFEQRERGITSKQRILALAGVWKDDPSLPGLVEDIYRQRGRPITEQP